MSDSCLGAEALLTMSFKNLILPERHPPHTELLDLDPLPLSALNNPAYESMHSFSHFIPMQKPVPWPSLTPVWYNPALINQYVTLVSVRPQHVIILIAVLSTEMDTLVSLEGPLGGDKG